MLDQLDQPGLCRVAVRNLLGHLAQEGTEKADLPSTGLALARLRENCGDRIRGVLDRNFALEIALQDIEGTFIGIATGPGISCAVIQEFQVEIGHGGLECCGDEASLN